VRTNVPLIETATDQRHTYRVVQVSDSIGSMKPAVAAHPSPHSSDPYWENSTSTCRKNAAVRLNS